MTRIVGGTSGWQYDSWRRRFYPADLPTSGWPAYLSERFASGLSAPEAAAMGEASSALDAREIYAYFNDDTGGRRSVMRAPSAR